MPATLQSPEGLELESLDACPLCGGAFRTLDDETHLAVCEHCEYVFDNPRPTINAIVQFYSEPQQYDSWIAGYAGRQRLWRRRLKKFLPHVRTGNLLDVGTGIGQFLYEAKPHFDSVSGTEVSESAIRIGKERFGLDIVRGEIQKVSFPPASFDNITLFHVLEHVPDPRVTLDRCTQLLKTGGVLLICVPNEVLAWTSKIKAVGKMLGIPAFRKFSRRYGISRAGSSREIHLSRFTPKTLKSLVGQSGFEVIDEGLDPYSAGTGILGALHRLYYGLHQVIFRVLGANRYDTIWMIARRN